MRTEPYRVTLNDESPLLEACTPELQPFEGALVVAALAQRGASCLKLRPVVLQSCPASLPYWRGWQLTTVPRFLDGLRRTRLYGLEQVGIPDPTFLWSAQLIEFPACEIRGVVWATPVEVLHALAVEHATPAVERWAERTAADLCDAGWYEPLAH